MPADEAVYFSRLLLKPCFLNRFEMILVMAKCRHNRTTRSADLAVRMGARRS